MKLMTRWFAALAVLVLAACDPTPKLYTVSLGGSADAAPKVRVWFETDTTLAVAVTYGYKAAAAPAGGAIDSAKVEVSLYGDATPRYVRMDVPANGTDTARVTVASYGTIRGWARVTPFRRGIPGAASAMTPWQIVRPDAAPPAYDSVTATPVNLSIEIRPQALQVDPDIDGTCQAWHILNPGSDPWIAVNQRAVPECMGPNDAPRLAQFCAFACDSAGCQHTTNLASARGLGRTFCEQQLVALREERSA